MERGGDYQGNSGAGGGGITREIVERGGGVTREIVEGGGLPGK